MTHSSFHHHQSYFFWPNTMRQRQSRSTGEEIVIYHGNAIITWHRKTPNTERGKKRSQMLATITVFCPQEIFGLLSCRKTGDCLSTLVHQPDELLLTAAFLVMSEITLSTVSSIGLLNSSLNSSRIVCTRNLKTDVSVQKVDSALDSTHIKLPAGISRQLSRISGHNRQFTQVCFQRYNIYYRSPVIE